MFEVHLVELLCVESKGLLMRMGLAIKCLRLREEKVGDGHFVVFD